MIELLIVIVIIGIISTFSMIAVSTIIKNVKENAFVNTAKAMLTSAKNAYSQSDPLFDDNIATLQELIDNGYIEISENDPWGEPYDTTNSYVTIDSVYKVKVISPTATIGYDSPLDVISKSDVIYQNGYGGSIIDGVIETVSGNVTTTMNGSDDNDSITIDSNLQSNGAINTFDGDDIVVVDGDVRVNAAINTGAGNDSITFDRLRGNASVVAGDGNDTLVIREIRYNTTINMGAGNDEATISSITSNYKGSISMGAGDDTLTIKDSGTPFQGVNGSFTGGVGNDTLNLPDVNSARWAQISHMFSGFETINLSDTTITS